MRRVFWIGLLCLMLTACGASDVTEETEYTEPATVCVEIETEATVPSEPPVFSEDITFSGTYVQSEDVMPYALFAPSSASSDTQIPVIVFLHGRGECNSSESWFMGVGMPQVMNEWSSEGFNAYIICPELFGRWNCGAWNNNLAASYVMELLDCFTQEYAVDMERIFLVGFSAGGMGVLKLAELYPDYFSKMVVMSAPAPGVESLESVQIPTVGVSESEISFNSFMILAFPEAFGADSVRYYPVKHAEIPEAAFRDDTDGNNRSDLVEWLFEDTYVWNTETTGE